MRPARRARPLKKTRSVSYTHLEFGHACVKAGYEAGAKNCIVRREDDKLSRLHYEYAKEEDLAAMKPYEPVSYTHLDVYKRQVFLGPFIDMAGLNRRGIITYMILCCVHHFLLPPSKFVCP